ncbi:hypothetical protein HRI_000049500 [Hibiscus trionum]|uniref:Uncharacterized protein n=1 Tax=Hibiscus trionum TaxID=183268 RepID=A0A9W7GQC9_HIBTR|nr:hypothetical protein HRI_000049500 [Hibiscus trionum]
MRPSIFSLTGSLFMLSEDGGLVEYHCNTWDGWSWVEHGTPCKDVTLVAPPQASMNPQAMASFKQAQALSGGPLVQARNFAVMTGVNAGISCVMKRLRGKEDVQSR